LDLRRLSLHADLIEQRSHGAAVPFWELMQADFVLFLRHHLQGGEWRPNTLLYSDRVRGPFEIFARAEAVGQFERVKGVLGIRAKSDLQQLIQAFEGGPT